MKNRYLFFKRLFRKYVIILEKNNKYYSFYNDRRLIKYIKNKDLNYIVIDTQNNIKKHEYQENKYDEYLYKNFLLEIFKKEKF